MLARALSLRNFRRYVRLDLELPEGVVGIVGPNGCGKSTLIEAMAWALYGNEDETTRGDKTGVLRSGASKGEKCEVALDIELDGKPYRAWRQMSSSGAVTATLESEGKLLAQGTGPVTEAVEKLLGMDYKAFFVSVFARQKELDALSRQTAGKRRDTVVRLLDIVTLDEAVALARSEANTARQDAEFRRRELRDPQTGAPFIEVRKTEVKGLESSASVDGAHLKELERSLGLAKDAVEGSAEELNASSGRKREHDALRESRMRAENELRSSEEARIRLAEELAELELSEKRIGRMEKSEKEYAQLRSEAERTSAARQAFIERREALATLERQSKAREERSARLGALEHELEKAEKLLKEMGEVDKKMVTAREDLEKGHSTAAILREKLSSTDRELAGLKKRLANFEHLGPDSRCPTCERPLREHYDSLRSKTKNEMDKVGKAFMEASVGLETAEEESATAKAQLDALEKRRAKLEDGHRATERKAGEVGTLRRDISAADKEIARLERRAAEIGKVDYDELGARKLEKARRRAEAAHEEYIGLKRLVDAKPVKEKELDRGKVKVAEAREALRKADEALKKLAFDERAHAKLESSAERAKEAAHDAAIELERAKAESRLGSERLERARGELARLEELEVELAAVEARVEVLARTAELLVQFKVHMVSRIRPALQEHTSRLLELLSNGRYTQVEIDEDYSVKVFDGTQAFDLKRFSGGEEDMVNLCLRLAISQLIAERSGLGGLNMVVLDEIFASQDQERRRNILSALNNLSHSFKQILLITHVEDVRDSVGSVVQVEMGEDGTSSARLM
jgi:exonuclease SbcC